MSCKCGMWSNSLLKLMAVKMTAKKLMMAKKPMKKKVRLGEDVKVMS